MKELSGSAREFVQKMTESGEQEAWGFEILSKRADAADFLPLLRDRGFFVPAKHPANIPVDGGKYVRVPYWSALDYLEACAKVASTVEGVWSMLISILVEITRATAEDRAPRNFHTFSKFAEIIGAMPVELVSEDVVALLPTWLNTEFDSGMVASELDKGLLRNLVADERAESWHKAVQVLYHCTALRQVTVEELGEREVRRESVVDDYWLKELLNHQVESLAKRIPAETARLLCQRTKELYLGNRASWLDRPAIESHSQNHEWGKAENHFVDSALASLLIWIDSKPDEAESAISELLKGESEILRRLGVHCLSIRWAALKSLLPAYIEADPFAEGLLHESFQLLSTHFGTFTSAQQEELLEKLSRHTDSLAGRLDNQSVRYLQRQWLMALEGKGNGRADAWFQDLVSDASLGPLPEHPDFHAFSESFIGSGPSPYSPDELVELARRRLIVEKLNGFVEQDSWRGPSVRSLSQSLEEAVLAAPNLFVGLLKEFRLARPAYQYGILNGFRRLWESGSNSVSTNWDAVWAALFDFYSFLLIGDSCYQAVPDEGGGVLNPTSRWLPSLIAGAIQSGAKRDEKAFPPIYFDVAFDLIQKLLEKGEAVDKPGDDAMTQAINSERGKALDALFVLGLRMCRVADLQNSGSHALVAKKVTAVFDQELATCVDGNFEFSTLAGAYLSNLEYIDPVWTASNIEAIFSATYSRNCFCAIAGLAYAPARRSTYLLLRDHGVILRAISSADAPRDGVNRILERIALAYLWGIEPLEGQVFSVLFASQMPLSLRVVVNFFSGVRRAELTADQVELILEFFGRCVTYATELSNPELLAALSGLMVFIRQVTDVEAQWINAVAPFAAKNHRGYDFLRELLRLVDANPHAVNEAFARFVAAGAPSYDYKGRMRELLERLSGLGLRNEALIHADALRALPGMRDLFRTLSSPSGDNQIQAG